jgi:hypothetical protein
MSEMDSREAEVDGMLRRSLAGPVPRLSPEFERRLAREVRRRPQARGRYERFLLVGYGAISIATSVVVMRGRGLGWGVIAAMTLGPLALVDGARRMRRLRRV